ncbi:hypothetical protein INT43_008878 [Umbelopsis isabellina]|uniref:Uncharacterized protein n=1 Tax=Mortierella isabellina TaxID=91625 RepID=A0A8H7UFN7_MORIS|nr:hypothetical protein INT43_008878 [Umbelopsis isabellina]
MVGNQPKAKKDKPSDPQRKPNTSVKGNKLSKPQKSKAAPKHDINQKVDSKPTKDKSTQKPKAHQGGKVMAKKEGKDKKNSAQLKTPNKHTANESTPKSGKRKHDMFFAPPEQTSNVQDDTQAKEESDSKVQEESEAVIETIKMTPMESPGTAEQQQQSDAAVRSGVISVVDKAHKRRKKNNIDVVAELEKNAQKVVRTDNSLGTGLEVDGWD